MALIGDEYGSFDVLNYETRLFFDGDTFDANQVRFATAVNVAGQTYLYYAGLPFSNRFDLGLATSDGVTEFTRYSNSSIVSPDEEPWFASFRLIPSTVIFENGIFKLWFFGNNSNSIGDSDQTTGWGYATSVDGVNWEFAPDPIRSETGSFAGNQLIEVVKLEGQYLAYYRDISGNDYNTTTRQILAFSQDGVNFSGDVEFDAPGGAELLAATVFESAIIAIWVDGSDYFAARSTDGVNFVKITDLNLPPFILPEDITVQDGMATVWCQKYEGPGTWGFGNLTLGSFSVPINIFIGESGPKDDPIIFNGSNGSDFVYGGDNNDDLSGLNGADELFGLEGDDQLFGGNGADRLHGGEGNDFLEGGSGNDTLVGNSGNDVMSGGKGEDKFVFVSSEWKNDQDTIIDFETNDSIVLSGFEVTTYEELQIIQVGNDAVISVALPDGLGSMGGVHKIILTDVSPSELSMDIFVFA